MKELLKNKWPWIALISLVPFFAIWIANGLEYAVVLYVVIGAGILFFLYQIKGKPSGVGQDNAQGSRGPRRVHRLSRRDEVYDCPQCDGGGRVVCDRCDGRGSILTIMRRERCPNCRGGKSLRCGHCGGSGLI